MEAVLRAERPAEPRWEDVEQKLLARIEAPLPARPARVPSWRERTATLAAAAAAIALGVSAGGAGAPAAAPPPERVLDLAAAPRAAGHGDIDLRALRPGDAVETAGAEISLVDPGAVRWTLSPWSRAVVRASGSDGVGHIVRLTQGSLHAEVTPRDPAEGLVEAFAVDVGGTRIAVHGTVFTVTRLDDGVEVDVERGAVVVGSAATTGAITGHILVGPSRGAFSLDGGRTARLLPASGAPIAARPPAVALADPETAQAAAVEAHDAAAPARGAPGMPLPAHPPAPAAAAALSDSDPGAAPVTAPPAAEPSREPAATLTPASVRAALTGCFAARQRRSSSSMETSIVSTLRISVRGDGSIAGVRFDPPLKPELQQCAQSVYAGRFEPPPGAAPVEIKIPLKIEGATTAAP
jgi:hypothetical protein